MKHLSTRRPGCETTAPAEHRRPYRAPRLTLYGDVRDLTMGPSDGIGESGMPLLFRVSGAGPSGPPRR